MSRAGEAVARRRLAQGQEAFRQRVVGIKSDPEVDSERREKRRGGDGEFARLDDSPKELVFKKAGEAIQLKVVAHWKDGTVEDVTQLTRFRTNDESVAFVNDTGFVTAKTPGDTHVVAFYDNGVEPVPALLPVRNFPR